MKATFVTLAALATGAIAAPLKCISQSDANKFMSRFISILEHVDSDFGDYSTTADRLLTSDFAEISDSINMLANKPLGSVTANKAAYIAGAQHAPPTTGIESLAVTVSNCNNLIWEWNMKGVGKATYPVKGFGLFKLVRSGKLGLKIQAKELKLEFNNIAWGLDTGYGWVKQDGTLLGRAPNPAPAPAPEPAPAPVEEEEETTEEGPAPETTQPETTTPETTTPETTTPETTTPETTTPETTTPETTDPESQTPES